MLDVIANLADPLIAATGIVFNLSLLPTLFKQRRERTCSIPLPTSVSTTACLVTMGLVFLSLGLLFSFAMTAINATLWGLLAAQRWIYKEG